MSEITTIAIIPARMGSSRYPGKPMAEICGRTMIEHVYRRTAMADGLASVYVATCDEEIHKAVESFGGRAIMTSDEHERASDRIVEAASDLEADIVVMVQGDEPMVHPEMIEEAVAPMLQDPGIGCVNLVHPIESAEDHQDPDTIKVVADQQGRALYMSREPIPTARGRGFESIPTLKQVCIIPFRAETLQLYAELKPTPLERAESIDMLRFIEHGHPVYLAKTQHETHAVDRPEDRNLVEELLREDPLTMTYLEPSEVAL